MAEKTAKTNPFEQLVDQATAMQAKLFETSAHALDESNAFAKTSFKYMTELSAEWSKAGVEASRKAMELFQR